MELLMDNVHNSNNNLKEAAANIVEKYGCYV